MPANPNATWTELLLAVQQVIQGLPLIYGPTGTALLPAQIYTFKFATDQFRMPSGSVTYPAIMLVGGFEEDVDDGEQTFEDTIMIYPIYVVILFASNRQLGLNNDLLYWRQQIIIAFQDIPNAVYEALNSSITDVNIWDIRLEPASSLDEKIFLEQNLDASAFVLTFRTSRDRARS